MVHPECAKLLQQRALLYIPNIWKPSHSIFLTAPTAKINSEQVGSPRQRSGTFHGADSENMLAGSIVGACRLCITARESRAAAPAKRSAIQNGVRSWDEQSSLTQIDVSIFIDSVQLAFMISIISFRIMLPSWPRCERKFKITRPRWTRQEMPCKSKDHVPCLRSTAHELMRIQ